MTTTPSSTPAADDGAIDTILNDYVIHGVRSIKCKDNAYMVTTLKRRLTALIHAEADRLAGEARIDELKRTRIAIKALHSFSSTDFTKDYDRAIDEMLEDIDKRLNSLLTGEIGRNESTL